MTPQQELFLALSTDSAILSVIGNDLTKISDEYPEIDMFAESNILVNFPRITYVLSDRSHQFFVDNIPYLDELQFNVEIWLPSTMFAEVSLNSIKLEIDRIVQALGYAKVQESEKRQIENRVSHLALTYSKDFPSNL